MPSLCLACGMFPWGLGISLPGSIIRKDNHLLCWWSPQSFCGWQLFEAWGFGNQAVPVEVFVGKCVASGVLPMLLYRLNLGNGRLPGLSCLQDDLNPKAASNLALSVQINVSTSNRIFLMFDEVQGVRQRQFQTNAMCSQISSKFSYLMHGMSLGGLRGTNMCVFQWRNRIQTHWVLSTKCTLWCIIQTTTWQVIGQRYFGSDLQPLWRRYGRAVRALEAAEQQAESRWQQSQAWHGLPTRILLAFDFIIQWSSVPLLVLAANRPIDYRYYIMMYSDRLLVRFSLEVDPVGST